MKVHLTCSLFNIDSSNFIHIISHDSLVSIPCLVPLVCFQSTCVTNSTTYFSIQLNFTTRVYLMSFMWYIAVYVDGHLLEKFLLCCQVDKEELDDAKWFGASEVRQMLLNKHPQGLFCPPEQAIAHQIMKYCLNNMCKL